MPRRLRPAINFHQPQFMQISESHCGPAVIQMMLSNLGIERNQEEIAEAAGVNGLIAMNGMRIDQMAKAVQNLAPDTAFYYKDHATIEELARIVQDYRYPVGVEWQGVFEDAAAASLDLGNIMWTARSTASVLDQLGLLPDSESEDNDYGHYSMVVRVDRRKRLLVIVDPYKDFYSQARIFDYDVFDRRWYDFNEVEDAATGSPYLLKDDHLMFLVCRRNVLFPTRLGMQSFR